MKLFSHYLKDRAFFITIYVVSVFVCLCVFKLYNLELEAFTYAFMLLCVLLVVCFFWDYHKYYKKHQTLVTLQSNSNISLSCDLQDSSLMGEDYHKILVAMKEYHDEYVISSENKMLDLEDYFTMWVHQAKLPIAAMKLLLEDEKLRRSDKTASGLGLYLCKNILDMLNHKITIESNVGKGTRVILDLTHFEGRIE